MYSFTYTRPFKICVFSFLCLFTFLYSSIVLIFLPSIVKDIFIPTNITEFFEVVGATLIYLDIYAINLGLIYSCFRYYRKELYHA